MKYRLQVLVALPALLVSVFSTSEGVADPIPDDGEWVDALAEKFEVPLEQLEVVEFAHLDKDLLTEALERRLGKSAPQAEDLRAAKVLVNAQEWLVLSLTLPEGAVGMAVRPNGAVGVRLWDAQDFDEDPDGAWSVFTEQLGPKRQQLSVPEGDVPSADEIEKILSRMRKAKGGDLALQRTLYEQRRLMRDNSFRFTRLGRLSDRGSFPESEWIVSWAENYSALAAAAKPLSDLLGEEVAASYEKYSRAGEASLLAGAEALAAEDRAGYASAAGDLYNKTCQACHRLKSDAIDGTIYRGLLAGLGDFGVRADLLRVGVDLWAVPGEAERSQEVADGVAALLVAASQLR